MCTLLTFNQPVTVEIRKAVITAAGKNQRTLPLQTLVDRDGVQKTALAIIIEEILRSGVEEICVVVSPGDEASYRSAAGKHSNRLQFVEQESPLGYGHAIRCAKDFTADQPFLLLVGDHLYISHQEKSCAQQLVEMARAENCSVSAVQATHESKLPYYGAVGGRLVPGRQRLYQIEKVIEKPTPTEAEQKLIVPGLRAGNYLCFFWDARSHTGRHADFGRTCFPIRRQRRRATHNRAYAHCCQGAVSRAGIARPSLRHRR